ncbi:hypothetical protein IDM40_03215 [Nocardiopsis sp. HNM0947]|uniref:Uncharacterized protein n=1 Tax=Nocardiopsis coralli TaxID=2772213 RepID=A0ABR9P1J6_9ACTN|nr:hypothetical protein [Nocardiopsis coralli]MBE2997721.1 hypothetical protein [Nocardiopsis coralli]
MRTLQAHTPARAAVLGWATLWLLSCCGWILLIGLGRYSSGPTQCAFDGTSFFGESSWSWLPPGQVCTWEVTAGGQSHTVTDAPSAARLAVPVLLLLWGATVATLSLCRLRG